MLGQRANHTAKGQASIAAVALVWFVASLLLQPWLGSQTVQPDEQGRPQLVCTLKGMVTIQDGSLGAVAASLDCPACTLNSMLAGGVVDSRSDWLNPVFVHASPLWPGPVPRPVSFDYALPLLRAPPLSIA